MCGQVAIVACARLGFKMSLRNITLVSQVYFKVAAVFI